MTVDNKTPLLNIPLPNIQNKLSDDVVRLQSALNLIDQLIDSKASKTELAAAVTAAITDLIDSSPAALDTLNELAAALGDDPNFAATMAAQLGLKLDKASYTAADVLAKLLTVDGHNSGLDADTLDGMHASAFAAAGHGHSTATQSVDGFMSSGDKTKLDGVATNANNYAHPTGDGNQHVPATGAGNNGKVLKAGSTAGSAAWGSVAYSEVTGTPMLGTSAAKNVPATGNAATGEVVLGNDSRLSDARSASDVYAWAKAATKPAYTPAEVGAQPVDADLTAIAGLAGTSGILKKTAADAWALDTTSYLPLGGGTMTGDLVLNGDATQALHPVTLQQFQSFLAGLKPKNSVKAATTANITLSGTQTIDGVVLVAGDRVLVKNQTTASQNGVYVVAAGAWVRATDADAWLELVAALVVVEQGTANGDCGWVCTADQAGTLGTTAVTWTQFFGPGAVTAGTGISISGTQVSLAALTDSGTGSLLKLTRDAYGRVSGTAAVTAADITGLSNLFGSTAGAALAAAGSAGSSTTPARADHVHPLPTPAAIGAQAALGFTPVQQGGGTGHGTNKVYIGWAADSSGVKLQIDTTDMGYIFTSANGKKVSWNDIQSKPTTLSGYSITDAVSLSSYTAADVLAKLLTVDGHNSGLDADTLDGMHASAFASAAQGAKADTAVQPAALGSAAAKNVPATGNAATGEVVLGNDSRLSDARTPTAHTHGNISNAGAIGTTSGLPIITTTGGVLTAGSFGTTAGTFCQGNDSRLSSVATQSANGLMSSGDKTKLDNVGAFSSIAQLITDWNNANYSGVFMGNETCANSPESGKWFMGSVEKHGGAGWCTQVVHGFANDTPTDTLSYRREFNNGAWGSWYRLRLSEEEQKLIFLSLTGGTMTGPLILSGDPTSDLHPATKRWVESLSGKNSVRVATAGVLGGVVSATQTISARANVTGLTGTTTSGSNSVSAISNAMYYIKVGAAISGTGIPAGATVTAVASTTITISANATATGTGVALTFTNPLSELVVDGVTLALNDRVLVKNEYSSRNGLYKLTTLGTTSVEWVLTRTTDADTWDDLVGASVAVEEGTTNAETSWLCTANRGGTLGATSIPWQLVSNAKLASLGNTTLALGDTLYASSATALTKLAGNTTTTRKFMRQTGTGAASAAPAWDTLTVGDLPSWAVGSTGVASFTANGFQVDDTGTTTTTTLGRNVVSIVDNGGQVSTWLDNWGFNCNLIGSGEELFAGSPGRGYGDGFQAFNGSNVAVLNSSGLQFSNSVDNSATNKLSWYECGTYTPVLKGATTAGTFTYTTQLGRYTRIGRMVYIDVNITVTGASVAPAGNLYVTLPKTAISDTNKLAQAAAITNNLTLTGQAFVQTISGSVNAAVLAVNNGVSSAVVSSSDTAFTIQFSLAYVAA